MVHPQALVEPMNLPLRPNPQKRKTNGTEFLNRDKLLTSVFYSLENFILNFFFIGNQFWSFKTRLSVFKSNCAVVLEKSHVF
jgi:hypothetical protein